MKNASFGLDIGTTFIKAVELDMQKDKFILRSAINTPYTAKGMLSESLFDQEEMAQQIKSAVIEAKITVKNVNIALPDNQVFTKVIEMPSLSDKELSSAIYWEAEQYIPAQLSSMMLDWHVLRRDIKSPQGDRMQVLLVAAATGLIKRYQKIIELSGLKVHAIETEILSVIRAVATNNSSPVTLIVDIGNLNTSLAIIQNGIVIFTYSFPLGGIAINRAISSDFGFTIEQAEEYKKTYGLNDTSLGGKISKAIEPVLQSILTEVKKALAFYSDKYKNQAPITQLLLIGGTARLPGLDAYSVKNLGIETAIANPFVSEQIQEVPKEILDNGSEYAIAVGLALRDFYED